MTQPEYHGLHVAEIDIMGYAVQGSTSWVARGVMPVITSLACPRCDVNRGSGHKTTTTTTTTKNGLPDSQFTWPCLDSPDSLHDRALTG